MDLAELTQRAKEGKPLYGESDQPLWVQGTAHNNSAFSQLKMRMYPQYMLRRNTDTYQCIRRVSLVSANLKHLRLYLQPVLTFSQA